MTVPSPEAAQVRDAEPERAAPAGAFELSGAHRALAAEVRELGERWAGRSAEVRAHTFDHGELHPGFWGEFAGAGYAGMMVPARYGGSDRGLLANALVLEELAARYLGTSVPVLTSAIAAGIAQAGPEPLRERHLPGVAAGERTFALAFTEPEAGHNFFATRTLARVADGAVRIDGTKTSISGADVATHLLVFARSLPDAEREERGMSRLEGFNAVVVPADAPGIRRTEIEMGGREGVRQWRLELDGVEVPAEEVVGAEHVGALGVFGMINIERVLFTAGGVGLAAGCIRDAIAVARERVVFGERPIGANQAIQHPLAELHARLEAARLLVYSAASRFDGGAPPQEVGAQANMAKLLVGEIAFAAADHAIQVNGGRGYDFAERHVERLLDARALRSAPVSQELALSFIAEHVLGLPRHR